MPTCSLSSYLAASAKSGVTLFRQIVTLIGNPCNLLVNAPLGQDLGDCKNSCHNDVAVLFTGLSGKTWETAKIAHESRNDVRHI